MSSETHAMTKHVLDNFHCHDGKIVISRTPRGRVRIELRMSGPGKKRAYVRAWAEEPTIEASIAAIYDNLYAQRPATHTSR